MPLSRRSFLAAMLASGALAACAPVREQLASGRVAAPPPSVDGQIWRALSRLTFAPHPAERERAAAIGLAGWVEEQLTPERLGDAELAWRLQGVPSLSVDVSSIYEASEADIIADLRRATLLRAIYSRRQLYELMVDFWSDHFSISVAKGDGGWLKLLDDRDVVRPHALGSFRDLLWASMSSPAMLGYLDNQQNRAGSPNENYARELLELHTLGVTAGYTQRDVQEVARCLTGWGVGDGPFRGQQRFDAAAHDDGPKSLLGAAVAAGGGARDPALLCEILLAHPATPRFIAAKLVRRFVGPGQSALEASAAAVFAQTGGDIRATMRGVLLGPEQDAAPPRLKRPLQLVAGALRQLDAETDAGPELIGHLARMGQPLFAWPTPDGFPEHDTAWSGALLQRWQFALALADGTIPGVTIDLRRLAARAGGDGPDAALDGLATLLHGAPPTPEIRRVLLETAVQHTAEDGLPLALALLLAAPAYQWR